MTVQNVSNVSQTFSLKDIANITQPKPSGWSKFKSVLGGIAGAASSFIPGAGIVSSLLGGGLAESAAADKISNGNFCSSNTRCSRRPRCST